MFSASIHLMFEPVTSIFSTFVVPGRGACANAEWGDHQGSEQGLRQSFQLGLSHFILVWLHYVSFGTNRQRCMSWRLIDTNCQIVAVVLRDVCYRLSIVVIHNIHIRIGGLLAASPHQTGGAGSQLPQPIHDVGRHFQCKGRKCYNVEDCWRMLVNMGRQVVGKWAVRPFLFCAASCAELAYADLRCI